MGRYFNENFLHAKVWHRRTMADLKQEIRARREARNPTKHAGGRPPLEIAPNEVYDALREGQTVTEVAKKFGISRGSVYKFKEGM